MKTKNIYTIIPNHNNKLFIAELIEKNDGSVDVDLLPVVAFSCVDVFCEDEDNNYAYTFACPVSFYSEHSTEDDCFVYDMSQNVWWKTKSGQRGKGFDSLEMALKTSGT